MNKSEKELNQIIIDTLRKAETLQDCNIRINTVAADLFREDNITISKGTCEGYYIMYKESHGNHDIIATIRIHYYPALLKSVEALTELFIK